MLCRYLGRIYSDLRFKQMEKNGDIASENAIIVTKYGEYNELANHQQKRK